MTINSDDDDIARILPQGTRSPWYLQLAEIYDLPEVPSMNALESAIHRYLKLVVEPSDPEVIDWIDIAKDIAQIAKREMAKHDFDKE